MTNPADPATPIASVAPPNLLSAGALLRRPDADGQVTIDPSIAGWRYLSFLVRRIAASATLQLPADGQERVLVVLGGGGIRIVPEGTPVIDLIGRRSVWDALPSAAYLPAGIIASISSNPIDPGGFVEIAIAAAPAPERPLTSQKPIRIDPDDCMVEVRGAGNATRQITHIVRPDFPAQRLLLTEAHTPGGNWSSWPPHKHDQDAMPNEAVLEEVYAYRFRRPDRDWGVQRVYRRPGTPLFASSGPRDAIWAVRHGDVVLVPDGYHPFVAAHGADAYYLNALAGDRRTMACSFDPDLVTTRDLWPSMEPDPRVPLVDRGGPTDRTVAADGS